MPNVNLCDVSFAHVDYGWNGDLKSFNSEITWVRRFDPCVESEVCFFTDMVLDRVDGVKSKCKIALLLEPSSICKSSYEFIINNCFKFDYVLTHNRHLLKMIPNGVYYPHGGTWIDEKDWGIHDKQSNVSMIASNKKTTDGHILRHSIIDKYKHMIDFICGRGYKYLDNKITALKNYHASIVIENAQIGDYFTEKLIDCFLTGTVPIYWNGGFIGKFFNTKGMLIFNDISELDSILKIDIKKFYDDNIGAIKENFELAKKYANTETWIYENFLKGILNND